VTIEIRTLGDIRSLTKHLPDDTRVHVLVIEPHRPRMIRRGSAHAEIVTPPSSSDTRVVVALRPNDALDSDANAHYDLGGEG
jgi:hypothetical protein